LRVLHIDHAGVPGVRLEGRGMTDIRIDPNDFDQPPPFQIAACQFGPGHDWIDITTLSDVEERYMCASCKAIGRAPLQPRRA